MRIAMLALAVVLVAAQTRAVEFRFELRNCQSKDIDVWVYNGRDTLWQIFAASGWQGMKYGQTIGFVCDEQDVGYCLVDVRAPEWAGAGRDPVRVDTRTACFTKLEPGAIYMDNRCYLCPP